MGDPPTRFAEKWWHFGRHPRCGLRYSDWFWWPRIGRYCYPCHSRAERARRVAGAALSGEPSE